MKNLSCYTRNKILDLNKAGFTINQIVAKTGLKNWQINTALWNVKTKKQ